MRAFILRRAGTDRARPRRRRRHRLDALRRDAAGEGVPDAERPPVSLRRSRSRSPTRRSCSIGFTSARADIPVRDLPRRDRAAQPDERSRSPTASASMTRSSGRTCATRHRRRRTGRACGGGLRRVRRARCPGARVECARRPGRIELTDRELPRLSDRHLRTRAGRPRVRAGAEVRRADPGREGRDAIGLRRSAVRRSTSTTGRGAGAGRHHRDRRRVPQAGDRRISRRFEGAGVYYGATPMEAQLCVGEDVVVVGGGNSAGQAAVFLAETAASRPHAGARPTGLADTMSRY